MFKNLKEFIKLYRKHGLIKMSWYAFKRNIGVQRQQEEIDTMFYFLNHYLDIQELPPTKDEDLRILQKCDAEFLKIFDIICKKHKITYWLDYGTLLGAVRHKGFIPWDDDMDLGITRSDFDRFMEDVKPDFEKNNIDVSLDSGRIGLGYKHKETGIWIDLFPVDDYYYSGDNSDSEKMFLAEKIGKYRKKYNLETLLPKEQYAKQRAETIGNIKGSGHRLIYHTPEFVYVKVLIHEDKDIFPLAVREFEGNKFPVPNNCEAYLNCIYGSHYMEFPRSGVEHHGGASGRLKTWAQKAGVDMGEVLEELRILFEYLQNDLLASNNNNNSSYSQNEK